MEAWQELAIGIICMVVLGPAVGNYATSVVYRLPRGQTPFEKHPYCGNCNTFLKPEDLFPIWSYVLLRGGCRYCGMRIPFIYTLVEIACGVLFVGNYLAFGISETFILLTSFGVFGITLAALEWQQQRLYSLILTYLFAIALIWRAMEDGSIYTAFLPAAVMMVLATALWRVLALIGLASRTAIPHWIWMAGLIGLMIPFKLALAACAIMLGIGWLAAHFARKTMWSATTMVVLFSWLWWIA